MLKNKKVLFVSLSALLVAVVLVLSLGLFQKDTKNTSEVASSQQTEEIEKSDVKKDEAKKTEKVESKEEEPTIDESKKENDDENKVESTEVKAEVTNEETVNTTTPVQNTESQSTTPSTEAVTPVTKYVNISSLNVRSGPGTNHSVISMVTQGQAVTVSELSDSWSKISVNGKTGWVSGKYLSDTKPAVAQKVETPKESTQTPAAEPSAPQNDADKLRTVNGNNQLILVTANGYGTRSATIQTFEKNGNGSWNRVMNISGFIGKNGFGKGQEGDGKTPIGKYSIGTAFGQQGNPGTKLPWRNITSDDVWVDDSNSPLYNSWQSKSNTQGQWNSAENMTHPLYVYGFVINYNTARTPGKGSAIFFHTGSSYTLGCVATSQSNVVSILKWLDPSKNPVIIMTPNQELGNY